MHPVKKNVLDRFVVHLKSSFEVYCTRHSLEKTDEQLIAYLIDHQLILNTSLQRFAVLREFEQMCAGQDPKVGKTEIVSNLAHKFCLSERTVWSILQNAKTPIKKKK